MSNTIKFLLQNLQLWQRANSHFLNNLSKPIPEIWIGKKNRKIRFYLYLAMVYLQLT